MSRSDGSEHDSFLLFKPDAVRRGLVDDSLTAFVPAGLRVRERHTLHLSEAGIAGVWAGIDPQRRPLTAGLMRRYLSSGPVELVRVGGPDAVAGTLALKSAIRQRYGAVYYANLVHSPDSAEEARRELDVFLGGRFDPRATFRLTAARWHGWEAHALETGLDAWWASVPEQAGRWPTCWSPPLTESQYRVHVRAKRHWAVAFDEVTWFLAGAAGVSEVETAVRAAFAALYDRDGFVLPVASARAAEEVTAAVMSFGLAARPHGPGRPAGPGGALPAAVAAPGNSILTR